MARAESSVAGISEAEAALARALKDAEKARSFLEARLMTMNDAGAQHDRLGPEEISLDSLTQMLYRAYKSVLAMAEPPC